MQKGHRQIIQTIIQKKYLTEMDILRLQKALLMCRMCADSTFLVDKQSLTIPANWPNWINCSNG